MTIEINTFKKMMKKYNLNIVNRSLLLIDYFHFSVILLFMIFIIFCLLRITYEKIKTIFNLKIILSHLKYIFNGNISL